MESRCQVDPSVSADAGVPAEIEWLTHNSIFLNIVNALTLLREKEGISTSCPPLNSSANKARWRVLHTWRPGKSRPDGMMKVGDDCGGGLTVSQERLVEAMKALNNFIHECKELHD